MTEEVNAASVATQRSWDRWCTFSCHWPPQRKNRRNVIQHHISGKSIEIVYATQKGVQLLRFELHEMADRHFLCLINIHKVAEETNSRTFLASTLCIYSVTAFYSTELGTGIVQELLYPIMAKSRFRKVGLMFGF